MTKAYGPCAKRKVVCTLVVDDDCGREHFFTGENECMSPQKECPRLEGEGYDKCFEICHTIGHAEIVALRQLKQSGLGTEDAVAIVEGHDHICPDCLTTLNAHGITNIEVVND